MLQEDQKVQSAQSWRLSHGGTEHLVLKRRLQRLLRQSDQSGLRIQHQRKQASVTCETQKMH